MLFAAKVVFNGEIHIAKANWVTESTAMVVEDHDEREVHSDFAVFEGSVAEFDGLRVLTKAGER